MLDVLAGSLYLDGKLLTPRRSRIIWKNGKIYAFTKKEAPDAVYDCPEEPKRTAVFRRKWHSGLYTIEEQCWTCGGHRKLAMMSERKLNYGD